MEKYLTLMLCISGIVNLSCEAQVDVPNKEVQIAGAIMAAPEDMREGAAVLGFDNDGNTVSLREGTNEMVCVADDPAREGFNTACYHKDLEPFMTRGRELRAQGIDGQDLFDKREQEVSEGSLKMPSQPTTLHILTGTSFSEDSMSVVDPYYRYVVYIPYATPESTGLPPKPRAAGEPWLMDPGTHRAHIMITPPRD